MMKNAGFTFIEMILALCVIGALFAIAAPRFPDLGSIGKAQDAERLRAALQQTRAAAIAAGRTARASFNARGAAFCWTSNCPAGGDADAPVMALSGEELLFIVSGKDDLIAPAHVDFGPDGTPSSAPTLAIGDAKVSIDAMTGVAHREG